MKITSRLSLVILLFGALAASVKSLVQIIFVTMLLKIQKKIIEMKFTQHKRSYLIVIPWYLVCS
jgi:hypothetical protein